MAKNELSKDGVIAATVSTESAPSFEAQNMILDCSLLSWAGCVVISISSRLPLATGILIMPMAWVVHPIVPGVEIGKVRMILECPNCGEQDVTFWILDRHIKFTRIICSVCNRRYAAKPASRTGGLIELLKFSNHQFDPEVSVRRLPQEKTEVEK